MINVCTYKGRDPPITGTLNHVNDGNPNWVCMENDCGKKFRSQHGLKVHKGRVHKVERNRMSGRNATGVNDNLRGNADRSRQYRRWSPEELRLLCKQEFELEGLNVGKSQVASEFIKRGCDRTSAAIQTKMRSSEYRAIREEMLRDFAETSSTSADEVLSCSDVQVRYKILELLRGNMKRKKQKSFAKLREDLLDEIARKAMGNAPAVVVLNELDRYYRSLVGIHSGKGRIVRTRKVGTGPNRLRKALQRIISFKQTQIAWRKNRSRLAKDIINGKERDSKPPNEIPGFFEHWKSTFEAPSQPTSVEGMVEGGKKWNVWYEITKEDIDLALRKTDSHTAPGPDRISTALIKYCPRRVLIKLFNLFLLCGRIPAGLKGATTVFIPKKGELLSPSNFRPLSMSSVILRLFNKILAKRVVMSTSFDYRQRAFLPMDGCCENIILLEAILDRAKRAKKNAFIAFLDLRNAFGLVTHESVFRALECGGASNQLVEYVRDLYDGYTTNLTSHSEEHRVTVKRGILQGDSLSPVLFNMVMDQVLKAIPEEVGFNLSPECRVNGMAFADDLTPVASSALGLQRALSALEAKSKPFGLEFNAAKCGVLALIARKEKGIMVSRVDAGYNFRIGGRIIPMIKESEPLRYLGAHFNERGIVNVNVELETWLMRVRRARLRVPQKLFVLRTHVLPKLIHQLCFANWTIGLLNNLDKVVREFLLGNRGILHTPSKIPKAFLYTAVADGGLGMMSFRRSIPAMTLRRFERLQENECEAVRLAAQSVANQNRISRSVGALISWEDILGEDRVSIQRVNKRELYSKVSGEGLKRARDVPNVHQWISNGTTFFNGRTFCDAIKLRINALNSKRESRNRNDKVAGLCRAGCGVAETDNHIMQACPVTANAQRERHNRVVRLFGRGLSRAGYSVDIEQAVEVNGKLWRPDLIARKGPQIYIIDPQIVGDQVSLIRAYQAKKTKYKAVKGFEAVIKRLYQGVEKVNYGSLILTRRGIVSRQSEQFRRSLCVNAECTKRCAMATIYGSVKCFRNFLLNVEGNSGGGVGATQGT